MRKLGLFPVALVLAFLGFTGRAVAQISLQYSPSSLTFQDQPGGSAPAPQTITVTSLIGTPVSFTAKLAPSGGNFFNVSPSSGTTPATITVSVVQSAINALPNPTSGESVGGNLLFSPSTGVASPVQLTVTLTVAATCPEVTPANRTSAKVMTTQGEACPTLTVTPNPLSFSYQPGQAPPPAQTLTVNSTGPESFTISGVPSWLTVTPDSGTTPATLSVSVNVGEIPPGGSQVGTFSVVPSGSGTTVSVTVTLTVGLSVSFAPQVLDFAGQTGGISPPVQAFVLTGIGAGQTYEATVSYQPSSLAPIQNWLVVSPLTGETSATAGNPVILSANVNPTGLPQGTFNATVTVLSANSSATASVSLDVSAKPVITTSAGSVAFNLQVGSSAPPPSQVVELTSTDGDAIPFTTTTTASTSSSGDWLTVIGEIGTQMTPSTVTLSLNSSAASLAAGTYVDTLNIFSSAEPTGTPQSTVTAILNITPPDTSLTPEINAVLNAASDEAGAVSPGLIVSIFGTNIGPATPAGLTLTDGKVSTKLAGTQVLFDNTLAPLIYVSSGQINAIVPYEIAGRAVTSNQVIVNGAPSAPFVVSVADTAPGIFTSGEGGTGQGAILNQDGTVNGASNPAAPGSTIVIFGTGAGVLMPPQATGSVTPSTGTSFPVPLATPVTATIGGQPAQIDYAGEAPGLVSGVLQVNAVIPAGAGSGAVPIVVSVGGVNSQANVTVQVR